MGVVSRKWMWVESMCVACGCGCKELYSYIDFLILLIPTPLLSVLFAPASLLFFFKKKVFPFVSILFVIKFK